MSYIAKIEPRGLRIAKKRPKAKARGASTASLRTVAFKSKIQKSLALSGVEVNRKLAWQIFNDLFYATVEFTVNDPEQRLPLSGVGTFSIRKSAPRKGKSEDYKYIPRYKIRPSSRIQAMLEEIMPDCRLDYDSTEGAGDDEFALPTPVAKKKATKKVAKKTAPAEEAVMKLPADNSVLNVGVDDDDIRDVDDDVDDESGTEAETALVPDEKPASKKKPAQASKS